MKALWKRTVLEGNCIVVIGFRDKDGYAKVTRKIDGKWKGMRAHRYVWEQTIGVIPHGVNIMHSCDNRACVALQHLSLGTQLMNMQDMAFKGRRAKPNQKLTFDQVLVIRARCAKGERQRDVARAYGITQANVSSIVRFKTRRHS